MDINNNKEVSAWVREQLAHVNPYTDKERAFPYAVGFLSSVIANMIAQDSANLVRFKLAVAAKWKSQQGPAAQVNNITKKP